MKKLLPVALDVEGRRVLIVGGGAVAARKAAAFAECGALITVVSPELAFDEPVITHIQRMYQTGDEQGFDLVIAATDSPSVNAEVSAAAKAAGIWVNDASSPQSSDFHTASVIRRGDIAVGVTTGGASPVLARHVRRELENALGPEYEVLLEWAAERRIELAQRGEWWRRVVASEVLGLLREGKRVEAERVLSGIESELDAARSD